jgi:prepilin-type N-terminal cleavage/methylation domain-containing protein
MSRDRDATPALSHDSGLTLVELMVAILLAAVLTAGLFMMSIGQTRTYEEQLRAISVQESLWGAMEYLQRQTRMAGYGFGGCPSGTVRKWNGQNGASAAAVDVAELTAIRVFNDCNLHRHGRDHSCYPPGEGGCPTCPEPGSGDGVDSFVVSYRDVVSTAIDQSATLLKAPSDAAATFDASSCAGLVQHALAVMWDPSQPTQDCFLFEVTNDPSTDGRAKKNCHVVHNSGGSIHGVNPPGGTMQALFPGTYSSSSVVISLGNAGMPQPFKFAIDPRSGTAGAVPRLVQWRNATPGNDVQTVAEGVEDLQISTACDVGPSGSWTGGGAPLAADGLFTEGPPGSADRRADEWAHNAVTDTSADVPPTCTAAHPVALVRITLVGRNASADPAKKNGYRPAAEDRAAGTVAEDTTMSGGLGTFPRAVLTVTVRPRNAAP